MNNENHKTALRFSCACGETNPDKFYGHKRSTCGACHNKYNQDLGKEKKDNARYLLGDKCKKCGFDKYKSSLDMHHLDPSLKDPSFKSMRS